MLQLRKSVPQCTYHIFINYLHQENKTRPTKYSAWKLLFMYARPSVCGWGYKYALKLVQALYPESNSSDVLAYSLVVSESYCLNIPRLIPRGAQCLAPRKGKHRCLAPICWNFLNFSGQKWKGQRSGSAVGSAWFPSPCPKQQCRQSIGTMVAYQQCISCR